MKKTKRIISLFVCLLMVMAVMPVSAVSALAEEMPEGDTPVYTVTGVSLNKTEHSVNMAGQYLQLTATVEPANADNKAVTWTSDNTKVATVDNNGKVTIIGFGVANITVKTADGGKTATCKITSNFIKLGDVDKDEKITAADARLALRKAVGLENYADGSDEFLCCDVDNDKKVTAADARLILRAAVGLEKLPEGGGHYHIYNTAAKTVAPTCTAEGYTSNVCMICKQTIKSNSKKALGHSWKAATCTAPKTCTRCGAKEGSALGHDYTEATCTEPTKCTRCGVTYGSALGHNYNLWPDSRCTRCGVLPEANIILPETPITISAYSWDTKQTSTTINSFTIEQTYYSYLNEIGIKVYFSGECIYNKKGAGQSTSMQIGWKVYDSEGYVVDSGTEYSDSVAMGEKYRDYIYFNGVPDKSYRLELLDVN